jgi:hypothetical protein
MTSDQIKADWHNNEGYWLKEIAHQLAVMNERSADPKNPPRVALCSEDVIPVRVMPE